MLYLQHSWEQLIQVLGAEPQKAQSAFIALTQAYSSPGRVYHTLDHIQEMLEWIDLVRAQASDLPAIQLAIWFHDSIYDTHAADNEEQSALYAQRILSDLALSSETIQVVAQMVLSTKSHTAGGSNDVQILCDADLAILGSSTQRYEAYAQAIRQEYVWVPEAAYRVGRAQVLQTFLQRTRIYWTETLYKILEKQARENIQREIASLV